MAFALAGFQPIGGSSRKGNAPMIPLIDAIQFLDNNESLKKLVAPFCEDGYSTMYL